MDLIKASKGFVFNKPIRFWAKSVLSGLSPHEKTRLRLASWQYLVPRKRTNILLGCSQTSHLLSSFHWSGGDGHRGIREEYVCGAKEDGSLPSALWMAQEAVHWCCPWHGWHLLHAYAGKRVKEPEWLHWLVVGVVMWSVMIPFLFFLRFSVYGLTAITIFVYLQEKTILKWNSYHMMRPSWPHYTDLNLYNVMLTQLCDGGLPLPVVRMQERQEYCVCLINIDLLISAENVFLLLCSVNGRLLMEMLFSSKVSVFVWKGADLNSCSLFTALCLSQCADSVYHLYKQWIWVSSGSNEQQICSNLHSLIWLYGQFL